MYRIILGKRIKEFRKELGLTQTDLAKIMGVSKTTICQWETIRQEPCIGDIVRLSMLFDTSVDYLLGLEDEMGNKKKFDQQIVVYTKRKRTNGEQN